MLAGCGPSRQAPIRALPLVEMADDHDPHLTGDTPTQAGLNEAKRLTAVAEGHERRVALREESARFLDERDEPAAAAVERREADIERDAARTAWDRAMALQGPTQMTQPKVGEPVEIPIPTRGDFIGNLEKVAPAKPVKT
jgi:hypothetical protein